MIITHTNTSDIISNKYKIDKILESIEILNFIKKTMTFTYNNSIETLIYFNITRSYVLFH